MRAYLDANIYVCYLLGEEGEEEISELFGTCAGCKFEIIASKTVFAEVQKRCRTSATVLLQALIDRLLPIGKIRMVEMSDEDYEQADSLNSKTGGKFGINDFSHALLAAKYADVFVTNDRQFSPQASGLARTLSLAAFSHVLES